MFIDFDILVLSRFKGNVGTDRLEALESLEKER